MTGTDAAPPARDPERAGAAGDVRVLVIDDEPAFAKIVSRIAKDLGYRVEVTTDAKSFMRAVERFDPTVIVLDLVMPGKDGIELIQWLGDRNCRARIVIVTGFHPLYGRMAEAIGQIRGLDTPLTLTKPVPIDELRAALSGTSATPGPSVTPGEG